MKHEKRLIFSLQTISELPIVLYPGDRVFLFGDLGVGKTTLVQHLLCRLGVDAVRVKSPTYVYYNRHRENIYHFDLYRLTSYDDFVNIGAEEILDDPNSICLIEWPELLDGRYKPTIEIHLSRVEWEDGVREARIVDYRK